MLLILVVEIKFNMKLFILTIKLTLITILLFSFINCDYDYDKKDEGDKDAVMYPAFVSLNYVQTVYNENGEIKSIIKGKQENIYDNPTDQKVFVDNLEMLYNEKDKDTKEVIPIKLTAKRGKLTIAKNLGNQIQGIEAWGDVVIIKQGGERIETQRMFCDNLKEQIYTKENEAVTVFRYDGTVTKGRNLLADKGLNFITIEDPVSSKIKDSQQANNM